VVLEKQQEIPAGFCPDRVPGYEIVKAEGEILEPIQLAFFCRNGRIVAKFPVHHRRHRNLGRAVPLDRLREHPQFRGQVRNLS
jgi:hypothetical protein